MGVLMEEEKRKGKEPDSCLLQNGYPVLVPCEREKERVIICDMCGHKNPEDTALCEMCSNYLKF